MRANAQPWIVRIMKLETLITRFRGRCVYCGVEVTNSPGKPQPTSATCDHFIPRSKGGHDGKSNKVLACYGCNQAKGDMDPRLILFTWLCLNPYGFKKAVERIESFIQQPARPLH